MVFALVVLGLVNCHVSCYSSRLVLMSLMRDVVGEPAEQNHLWSQHKGFPLCHPIPALQGCGILEGEELGGGCAC